MKYILLSLLILFPICLNEDSHMCNDKRIVDDNNHLTNSFTSDVTKAFNGAASCSSLLTEDDDEYICCYAKIKFKNEILDETFTHKGCGEVSVLALKDEEAFSNFTDTIEEISYVIKTDSNNETYSIVYKSIDIDCSSKFLKYAVGLCLLLFFL